MGKLTVPCLSLVTDRRLCRVLSLEEAVAQAVEGGANLVQLREKDLPAADLLALAEKLRAITHLGRALFLVNDRLDVALTCAADGVHLPEQGLPVAAARRLAGEGFIIGRSVHSVAEAVRAQAEGADYVQVGTIFASRSHPGQPAVGPGLLEAVAAAVAVTIPILAVGGITAANVGEAMAAGAGGAAVISAILATPSPREAARGLAQAMVAVGTKARR